MTVKRPIDAAPASTSVPPPPPPGEHLDSAIDAARGAEPAARADAIVMSERARAMLQSSTLVRACLFPEISTIYRTVEISAGTMLTLESGVYRLRRG